MIDNFALAISHGLMLLAGWLLLRRDDLDREAGPNDAVIEHERGRRGA